MIRVEIDETIRRPIEQVFARLVDIANYAEWMPNNGLFIASTKDSAGPVGPGTAYSDKTRLGTVQGEISRFEPPNVVVFHYAARLCGITVMEGWPGYTLERLDDTLTVIHHRAAGRLYGPFKIRRRRPEARTARSRGRRADWDQSRCPRAALAVNGECSCGRVPNVCGNSFALYLVTDEANGELWRIAPR